MCLDVKLSLCVHKKLRCFLLSARREGSIPSALYTLHVQVLTTAKLFDLCLSNLIVIKLLRFNFGGSNPQRGLRYYKTPLFSYKHFFNLDSFSGR